jgi:serine/threonine protein phosphatase PrpC
MTALSLDCAVESDVGRRPNNEDSAYATTRLAVIADGVGGATAGEVASRLVVDAFIGLDKARLERPLPEALRDTVQHGNETLRFLADCQPELATMSTTVTAVALTNEGEYLVVNVGDSRTYLYREGVLSQLTRDDSLVQALLESGAITEDEARHHPARAIVMAALDGQPLPEPNVLTVPAKAGDRLLLCSDGLSDAIDDETIAAALEVASNTECAHRLVKMALDAGGRDNISVVIADAVSREDSAAGWKAVPGPGDAEPTPADA